MKSIIEILKAIPLVADAIKGIVSMFQRAIDKFKSKKIKRKVKEAMENEDRNQASTDLDDIFRDD